MNYYDVDIVTVSELKGIFLVLHQLTIRVKESWNLSLLFIFLLYTTETCKPASLSLPLPISPSFHNWAEDQMRLSEKYTLLSQSKGSLLILSLLLSGVLWKFNILAEDRRLYFFLPYFVQIILYLNHMTSWSQNLFFACFKVGTAFWTWRPFQRASLWAAEK